MAEPKADRNSLIRQAYGQATAALREAHRPEFNELMKVKAKDLGVEWSPKPTSAEKAAETLRQILAEHPELAGQIPTQPESQTP